MKSGESNTSPAAGGNGKPAGKSVFRGFVAGLSFGLIAGLLIILLAHPVREGYDGIRFLLSPPDGAAEPADRKEIRRVERRIRTLRIRLDNLIPRSPYMIINTIDHRFLIKSGRKILHEGFCSTGSYTLLKTHDGEQTWLFKTPRGMFRVRDVVHKPVWRMPDWVFVEEGRPVPAPDARERFERGVLGDYAFDLGNGYLIHGTLYPRFLGLPVTHGCVRLGDEDLKKAYTYLGVGARVFIY
ncbi:MAG TPA: L,D-transpeptidase [bacterium]|nr:L,D-transpeptidase [bacterium]